MSAKTQIITLPHQDLRKRSKKIGLITKNTAELAQNMADSLLDWEEDREHEVGVALAAVQIDKLYRLVVVRNDIHNKSNRQFDVYINPEITKYEGNLVQDYEGCLSIKDIYGFVPRYEKVKVKALGLDGQVIRVTAEGFLARVLQHEIDHTNGVVFIDHIKDDPDAFFILNQNGNLEELDYEKDVQRNTDLWGE